MTVVSIEGYNARSNTQAKGQQPQQQTPRQELNVHVRLLKESATIVLLKSGYQTHKESQKNTRAFHFKHIP